MEDLVSSGSTTFLAESPISTKGPILPPCRVCGDKATGFHYGQNTCEACKAFFTRSIKRPQPYKCYWSGSCVIGISQKRLCSGCRLHKCLSIGMSKEAIKTGRYKLAKHTENILEVKASERRKLTATEPVTESSSKQPTDQTLSLIRVSHQNTDQISSTSITYLPAVYEDIIQLVVEAHDTCLPSVLTSAEQIMEKQKLYHEEYALKQELFGPRAVLSKEQYEDIYQTTGIDIDGRREMMMSILEDLEELFKGLVSFVKSTQLFSELTIADKANLLKSARVDCLTLENLNRYSEALEIYVNPFGRCFHKEEIEKLKDYMLVDFSLARCGQKLNLKHEEVVLVMAICIMSADRCELDDPQKVADIQWKLTQSLMHLLEKNHHCHSRVFARIIGELAMFRKLADMSLQHPDIRSWPGIETFPLSLEFCNHCQI